MLPGLGTILTLRAAYEATKVAIQLAAESELANDAAESGAETVEDYVDTQTVTAAEEAAQMEMHNKLRMRDQCYLAYHLSELAEIHRQTQVNPASLDIIDAGNIQKFPRYTYAKTALLDGRPAEVMPKLHMRKNAHKILDATTAQLANLVPRLKLFKVKNTPTTSYEIPFKFYNHTITEDDARKDWDPNTNNVTSEFNSGIGGVQGRTAVGIKSFDWQYISGNFDTVQKDITAKLVLYFQSMDELIRVRQTQVYDPEQDQMIIMTYSYLDLIVNPARSSEATSLSGDTRGPGLDTPCSFGNQFDSSDYEIKASVGWAQWDKETKEMSSDFVESVNHSTTNLFLGLMDHSFSIGQDGTFELTITYRSRMEGLLESPKSNVLFADKDIVNNSASFNSLITYETSLEDLNQQECVDNREEKERLKKKLVKVRDGLRNETYKNIIMNLMHPQRFVDGFDQLQQDRNDVNTPAEVPEDNHGLPPQSFPDGSSMPDDPPAESAPANADFLAGGETEQRLIYSILTSINEHAELADTGRVETEQFKQIGHGRISTNSMEFEAPDWLLSELTVTDGDKIVFSPANPEERIVNYFYLGDLLDMLMITVFNNEKYDSLSPDIRKKYAFNNSEIENLRLALGPIEFRDPIDHKLKTINMADVAISVKAFTSWFHKNVIKKRRVIYEFQTFLKDMISQLLQTSLGKECFDNIERHNSSIRTHYVSAPLADRGSRDPIFERALQQESEIYQTSDSFATPRVDMNQITIEDPIFSGHELNNRADQHVHYIVAYSQGPAGLRYPGTPGNELENGMTPRQQDLQKGIYHLFIGRDRGLVKTVNFSQTNQPYLRQARLENMGAFNPIAQLSDVYEATIEMMGNTLFLPGSRLYLNPFGLAWGQNFGMPHNRGTIANIMGLGGYHIITNVSNYIESGVFKTTLQARFETAGDGCVATNANDDDTGPCPEETD